MSIHKHPFYNDALKLVAAMRSTTPQILERCSQDQDTAEGREALKQIEIGCTYSELLHGRGWHDALKRVTPQNSVDIHHGGG